MTTPFDSNSLRRTLNAGGRAYDYVSLEAAEAAGLAGQMQLGRITALETGNPAELANLASLHPAVMRTFLEQVRDTLGIDVLQALNPQRTPQP